MPHKKEDRVPAGYLSSPNEVFSTGNQLHLIEFLAKGVVREPTKQHCRLPRLFIGCSPKGLIVEDNTYTSSLNMKKSYAYPVTIVKGAADDN